MKSTLQKGPEETELVVKSSKKKAAIGIEQTLPMKGREKKNANWKKIFLK